MDLSPRLPRGGQRVNRAILKPLALLGTPLFPTFRMCNRQAAVHAALGHRVHDPGWRGASCAAWVLPAIAVR